MGTAGIIGNQYRLTEFVFQLLGDFPCQQVNLGSGFDHGEHFNRTARIVRRKHRTDDK
jgi:hypothetical protein